jgi:hypothetical protein
MHLPTYQSPSVIISPIYIVLGSLVRAHSIQNARLSLQSSEFAPPAPHPQASVPPPFGSKDTLAGEGAWGSNSDEGTVTLVLKVLYNSSTEHYFLLFLSVLYGSIKMYHSCKKKCFILITLISSKFTNEFNTYIQLK